MRARLITGAVLAAFLLSSCGVKGPLVRPAPMFGSERDRYIAEQARLKAEADARAAAGEAPAPVLPPPPPVAPVPSSPVAPTIPR